MDDIMGNHAYVCAIDVTKVDRGPNLTNDHSLQASDVSLLGCDLEIAVDNPVILLAI
jgi:hypothetical protein